MARRAVTRKKILCSKAVSTTSSFYIFCSCLCVSYPVLASINGWVLGSTLPDTSLKFCVTTNHQPTHSDGYLGILNQLQYHLDNQIVLPKLRHKHNGQPKSFPASSLVQSFVLIVCTAESILYLFLMIFFGIGALIVMYPLLVVSCVPLVLGVFIINQDTINNPQSVDSVEPQRDAVTSNLIHSIEDPCLPNHQKCLPSIFLSKIVCLFSPQTLICMLLLMSGDIESNPGPPPPNSHGIEKNPNSPIATSHGGGEESPGIPIAASHGGGEESPSIPITASHDGGETSPSIPPPASRDGSETRPSVQPPASHDGSETSPSVPPPASRDGGETSPGIPPPASHDGSETRPGVSLPLSYDGGETNGSVLYGVVSPHQPTDNHDIETGELRKITMQEKPDAVVAIPPNKGPALESFSVASNPQQFSEDIELSGVYNTPEDTITDSHKSALLLVTLTNNKSTVLSPSVDAESKEVNESTELVIKDTSYKKDEGFVLKTRDDFDKWLDQLQLEEKWGSETGFNDQNATEDDYVKFFSSASRLCQNLDRKNGGCSVCLVCARKKYPKCDKCKIRISVCECQGTKKAIIFKPKSHIIPRGVLVVMKRIHCSNIKEEDKEFLFDCALNIHTGADGLTCPMLCLECEECFSPYERKLRTLYTCVMDKGDCQFRSGDQWLLFILAVILFRGILANNQIDLQTKLSSDPDFKDRFFSLWKCCKSKDLGRKMPDLKLFLLPNKPFNEKMIQYMFGVENFVRSPMYTQYINALQDGGRFLYTKFDCFHVVLPVDDSSKKYFDRYTNSMDVHDNNTVPPDTFTVSLNLCQGKVTVSKLQDPVGSIRICYPKNNLQQNQFPEALFRFNLNLYKRIFCPEPIPLEHKGKGNVYVIRYPQLLYDEIFETRDCTSHPTTTEPTNVSSIMELKSREQIKELEKCIDEMIERASDHSPLMIVKKQIKERNEKLKEEEKKIQALEEKLKDIDNERQQAMHKVTVLEQSKRTLEEELTTAGDRLDKKLKEKLQENDDERLQLMIQITELEQNNGMLEETLKDSEGERRWLVNQISMLGQANRTLEAQHLELDHKHLELDHIHRELIEEHKLEKRRRVLHRIVYWSMKHLTQKVCEDQATSSPRKQCSIQDTLIKGYLGIMSKVIEENEHSYPGEEVIKLRKEHTQLEQQIMKELSVDFERMPRSADSKEVAKSGRRTSSTSDAIAERRPSITRNHSSISDPFNETD